MTDSVDTAALRVLANNINVAPAIWGHDAVRPLRAAAGEIDALRARAERAEAAIADLRRLSSQYDDDTQEYWVSVNDIEMILSRAARPASEVEQ